MSGRRDPCSGASYPGAA